MFSKNSFKIRCSYSESFHIQEYFSADFGHEIQISKTECLQLKSLITQHSLKPLDLLRLSPFQADFPDTLVSSFVQNIAKAELLSFVMCCVIAFALFIWRASSGPPFVFIPVLFSPTVTPVLAPGFEVCRRCAVLCWGVFSHHSPWLPGTTTTDGAQAQGHPPWAFGAARSLLQDSAVLYLQDPGSKFLNSSSSPFA